MSTPRVLVAGIGNIFLGDDAFGVEVAQRLLRQAWPEGVKVADFGIRGLDLAYALTDGYDAALLIDALPRGAPPGTLCVLEPDLGSVDGGGPAAVEPHAMDPVRVLRLAQTLGARPPRILVLGCEPAPPAADEEFTGLSPPVSAAIDGAVAMAELLVQQLCAAAVAP